MGFRWPGRLAFSWICPRWTAPSPSWRSPKSLKPLCIQVNATSTLRPKATRLSHPSRLVGSELLITRERRMEGVTETFQSRLPTQAYLFAHSFCGDKDPDVRQ